MTENFNDNTFLKLKLLLSTVVIIFIMAYLSWQPYREAGNGLVNLNEIGFSLKKVESHLDYIASMQRSPGTLGHQKSRKYIVDQLRTNGLQPEVQQSTVQSSRLRWMGLTAKTNNIIARIKGIGNGDAILFVAHYDSVTTSNGANDNAVGVSSLLELSRLYSGQNKKKNDIIILFTDAEESGLLGAEAFVKSHPFAKDVKFIVNLEARGTGGPSLLFETNGKNSELIDKMAKSSESLIANSIFHEIYKFLPNDTDFSVLKSMDVPGLNFAYIEGLNHYHTENDNRKSVDQSSLAHHSSYVISALNQFGNADLNSMTQQQNIYFNFPGLGLVYYPEYLVVPANILLLMLIVFLFIKGIQRGEITLRSTTISLALISTAIVGIVAMSALLSDFVIQMSEALKWSVLGAHQYSYLHLIAILLVSTALLLLVFRWCIRKLGFVSVYVAGLVLWLIFSVITAVVAKGANYIFFWPLLLSMLGFSYITFGSKKKEDIHWRLWIGGIISSSSVLLIYPVISLLFTAMELNSVVVITMITLITLWLICPLLLLFDSVLKQWAPISLVLLSLTSVITLSSISSFSADNPKMQSLSFLYDSDTQEGYWLSTDRQFDHWSQKILGGSQQRASFPKYFGAMNLPFVFKKSSETPSLERPLLITQSETSYASTCKFTLSYNTKMNADQVWISMPGDRKVISAIINDLSLEAQFSSKNAWTLRHIGVGDTGLQATFEIEGTQPVRLNILEHAIGLQVIDVLRTNPRPSNSTSPPYMDYLQNSTFQSVEVVHECDQ